MVLIRRLLQDAQAKFRKMVEDNKHLASKIDCSIQAANQEVTILRTELQDTNKRLSQIGIMAGQKDCAIQCDGEHSSRHKTDEENELIRLREENSRLEMQVKLLSCDSDMKKELTNESSRYGEAKLELIQSKQELSRAKDALQAMKTDRKRLKAEKLELLNQMKVLYTTLEDKETELRDFIRNYEQQMRENDETIKQLASERETVEQEKFEIIRQARDAQERAVILSTQNDTKEQQIKKLEAELNDLKEQSIKLGCNLSIPDTPDSTLGTTTPNSEDLPPYETPPSSAIYTSHDGSFDVPVSTPKLSRKDRNRSNSLTPLIMEDSCIKTPPSPDLSHLSSEHKKKHKRISLGSISKVFTRSKVRRSIAVPDGTDIDGEFPANSSRITLLNSDNYQEKLALVEQSKGSHMSTWKANQVLAWLEIVVNMPLYGKMCTENVKSGKVLLGLSDSELTSALGITNPMHRKKLRLAIEEQRNPGDKEHLERAHLLDHTWVAHRWLPDIGLPQYTSAFETNLVDGRILNSLSKKEMEKHLSIHRKFHQASILHAVELLRRLGYNKEGLNERRQQCVDRDTDPLVWSNERVIKWVQSIDLEEYAGNLKESGVHGALMVLESQFNSDALATALGIPPSKSYIRRHLKTELESLVKTARESILVCNGTSKYSNNNATLGRSFPGSSLPDNSGSKTRLSFRGSLGRAFGRKVKEDLNKFSMDLETPKRKISSPMNFQHNTLQSVFENEAPKS